MRKLICKVVGHDWEKRPAESLLEPETVIGVCWRCGDEAYSHEAMSHGGRDVPDELLDQDDVDMLIAMYRDGKIDREKFELGVSAALGDEEAAEKLERRAEVCD